MLPSRTLLRLRLERERLKYQHGDNETEHQCHFLWPPLNPFFPHTILPNGGTGQAALPSLPGSPLGSYATHAHPTLVTQSREGLQLK